MFKTLINTLFRKPQLPRDQFEALRQSMDRPLLEHEIRSLFPIIAPPDFLELNWPGFIEPLGDLPFSLTWGVMRENQILAYVSFDTAANWEKSGIDWRNVALDNLKRITDAEPASHEFRDDDGRLFCHVLINEDTFGPSRLLIPHLFENKFGPDYRCAIPERSCAIVYQAELTGAQRAKVDEIIQGCFDIGTAPMSPEHFEARRFWVLQGQEQEAK